MKKWLSCVPLGLCAVISCGGGRTPAAVIAPPLPVPKACTDEPDMRERLVIDWSSLDRSKLEAIARVGVVAVRVEGCRMRVVDGCASPHGYSYVATSRQREVTLLRGDDELGIELPMLMGRIGGSITGCRSARGLRSPFTRYVPLKNIGTTKLCGRASAERGNATSPMLERAQSASSLPKSVTACA